MSKRKGVLPILFLLIFTIVCVYTALIGWGRTGTGAMKNIITGLDLSGGVSITYEADEESPDANDMDDTVWKLQQRVQNYSTEANVYKEGTSRINVEIPGVTDANTILEDLGTPGSLYFISQTDNDGNENYSFTESGYALNYSLEELIENGSVVCEGADVASAEGIVTQDQTTQATKAVVDLSFTSDGAKKFADATTKAYSAGESIGIYYDGAFVSVPTVNSAITDGKAVIEGMSDIEEAKALASYIRIGGLKVTLHEIRSNVVGAQLGQEAIRTSLIGGAIGLAIVCLIMIIAYLLPGVIASFALILYTSMMLILLNAFDLTLTLPGIAGIILGIGMAVDANVVIYSRIQEEITKGLSVKQSIDAGFNKAMSAVIDGNVTTLIAAAVLGSFGSGTIKGFAMTLALSVVLSMFTALVISKTLCRAISAVGMTNPKAWARKKRVTHFDFVKSRRKFVIVALLVCVAGCACATMNAFNGAHALNFSMDFTGGTATTVSLNEDMTQAEIEEQMTPILQDVIGESGSGVSFQKVVGSNEVILKTRTLTVDERQALSDRLTEEFKIDESSITAESISATVGKEMRNSAIIAVVLAVALMLLYIFIRFRDIRFASAAIIALCHDVAITLMAYAIVRISVGNSFIAVMLTILGYSINSTIVIFDRIREKTRGVNLSRVDLKEVVNEAVNATLTRSILTNLTTFSSILILFILGVSSIKEFTLPMMVGIIAGALSSVFLTGPLWYSLKTRSQNKASKKPPSSKQSKKPRIAT